MASNFLPYNFPASYKLKFNSVVIQSSTVAWMHLYRESVQRLVEDDRKGCVMIEEKKSDDDDDCVLVKVESKAKIVIPVCNSCKLFIYSYNKQQDSTTQEKVM